MPMTETAIGAIAAFILVFGVISRRLEKSIVTPPMAYVLFGLLISSSGLGLVREVTITNKFIKIMAEIALAVVLFTDASRIKLKVLRHDYRFPLRLLSIGLPITIILGTLLALLLFPTELDLWSAAVLATILAPTDAALGQAVVNSSRIPASIRQAINIESGLNDGICLPILILFLSLATDEFDTAASWLTFTSKQIVLGTVVGMAVGYLGIKAIATSLRRQWMTDSFEDLSVLSLSILAYTLAEMVGGNGFIAAFCAGFILDFAGTESILNCLQEFGEAEGQLLTLITFLLFGAVMVIPSISTASWQVWVYAIGSLTVTRMIGVAIAFNNLKLQLNSIFFVGWFGPRGIASLVYGLTILEYRGLQDSELIFTAMAVTVTISVFAHGMTAFPGAVWYAHHISQQQPIHYRMPEMMPVEELPVRLPWRY